MLNIVYNEQMVSEEKTEPTLEELVENLTPELRKRYDDGEINVFPSQNPKKPVVRDVVTGVLVKGTGLTPKHNDSAEISRRTAYKRSNDYHNWLNSKLKIDGSGPQDKESAEWWWARAQEAALHSYAPVTCPNCQTKFEHRVGKQDGNLIFKILELATGKATQKTEVNVRQEEIIKILNEETDVREITIHTLTPDEVEKRRMIVEGQMAEDNA